MSCVCRCLECSCSGLWGKGRRWCECCSKWPESGNRPSSSLTKSIPFSPRGAQMSTKPVVASRQVRSSSCMRWTAPGVVKRDPTWLSRARVGPTACTGGVGTADLVGNRSVADRLSSYMRSHDAVLADLRNSMVVLETPGKGFTI